MVSRRQFLAGGLALAPALGVASRFAFAAATEDKFVMGSQSWSFRHFPLEEAIAKLKELGLNNMEFSAAHFKPDATDPNFAKVKETIEKSGIKAVSFGVEDFTKDAAANRKKFEFAKALNIGILSANPTPDSFDNLDVLCKEFNIKIAIHNHGPGARYVKVADTLKAVEGHSPLIGACVDTGHVIHADEKPHEVIKALGARVHSLHLKDRKFGGDETIIGQGDMDLVAVAKELKALNFKGPIDMEYELREENPVPDMKIGLENWRKAVATAFSA